MDLTLLADLRRLEPHRFYLTCVSGEVGAGRGSDAWGQALLLEKDDRIVLTPRPRPPPQLARNGSQRITLHGFSKPSDLVGVFSCVGGSGTRRTSVLYVHNSPGGESGPCQEGEEGLPVTSDRTLHTPHSPAAPRQSHTHGEQRRHGCAFCACAQGEADRCDLEEQR